MIIYSGCKSTKKDFIYLMLLPRFLRRLFDLFRKKFLCHYYIIRCIPYCNMNEPVFFHLLYPNVICMQQDSRTFATDL